MDNVSSEPVLVPTSNDEVKTSPSLCRSLHKSLNRLQAVPSTSYALELNDTATVPTVEQDSTNPVKRDQEIPFSNGTKSPSVSDSPLNSQLQDKSSPTVTPGSNQRPTLFRDRGREMSNESTGSFFGQEDSRLILKSANSESSLLKHDFTEIRLAPQTPHFKKFYSSTHVNNSPLMNKYSTKDPLGTIHGSTEIKSSGSIGKIKKSAKTDLNLTVDISERIVSSYPMEDSARTPRDHMPLILGPTKREPPTRVQQQFRKIGNQFFAYLVALLYNYAMVQILSTFRKEIPACDEIHPCDGVLANILYLMRSQLSNFFICWIAFGVSLCRTFGVGAWFVGLNAFLVVPITMFQIPIFLAYPDTMIDFTTRFFLWMILATAICACIEKRCNTRTSWAMTFYITILKFSPIYLCAAIAGLGCVIPGYCVKRVMTYLIHDNDIKRREILRAFLLVSVSPIISTLEMVYIKSTSIVLQYAKTAIPDEIAAGRFWDQQDLSYLAIGLCTGATSIQFSYIMDQKNLYIMAFNVAFKCTSDLINRNNLTPRICPCIFRRLPREFSETTEFQQIYNGIRALPDLYTAGSLLIISSLNYTLLSAGTLDRESTLAPFLHPPLHAFLAVMIGNVISTAGSEWYNRTHAAPQVRYMFVEQATWFRKIIFHAFGFAFSTGGIGVASHVLLYNYFQQIGRQNAFEMRQA